MVGERDSATGIDRRAFLKTTGIGFAVVGTFAATASAKPASREDIEQSLRVKEETGSIEKWHQFLRNRGSDVTSETATYEMPVEANSSGDVSTQDWTKAELDITLTIGGYCTTDGPEYYADLSWSYDDAADSGNYGYGRLPLDIAGISYDYDWWDLTSYSVSEATSTSSYVTTREESFTGTGPAFEVNDYDISYDGAEQDLHYGGVYLEPIGDYSPSERRLQGGYTHTWNSITIDSVSVSFPAGVGVSVSDATYKWNTKTEQDQDTLLRVSQG